MLEQFTVAEIGFIAGIAGLTTGVVLAIIGIVEMVAKQLKKS